MCNNEIKSMVKTNDKGGEVDTSLPNHFILFLYMSPFGYIFSNTFLAVYMFVSKVCSLFKRLTLIHISNKPKCKKAPQVALLSACSLILLILNLKYSGSAIFLIIIFIPLITSSVGSDTKLSKKQHSALLRLKHTAL